MLDPLKQTLKCTKYSEPNLVPILAAAKKANAFPEAEQDPKLELAEPASLRYVGDFHRTFGCPVLETPVIPETNRCELRVSLLTEELQELSDAVDANDVVEVADAFADLQYVLAGAILEFGLVSLLPALVVAADNIGILAALCGTPRMSLVVVFL